MASQPWDTSSSMGPWPSLSSHLPQSEGHRDTACWMPAQACEGHPWGPLHRAALDYTPGTGAFRNWLPASSEGGRGEGGSRTEGEEIKKGKEESFKPKCPIPVWLGLWKRFCNRLDILNLSLNSVSLRTHTPIFCPPVVSTTEASLWVTAKPFHSKADSSPLCPPSSPSCCHQGKGLGFCTWTLKMGFEDWAWRGK